MGLAGRLLSDAQPGAGRLVAFGAIAMALGAAGLWLGSGLWALVGALAGFGGVVLAAAGLAVARLEQGRAAFAALMGASPFPAALTDAEGVVLAANRAMRVEAGGHPAEAHDLLARWSESPEALAYRLINAAHGGDGRRSIEVTEGPRGWASVEVQRVGGDRLLWTVAAQSDARAHAAPQAPDQFIEALPVAIARLDPDGAITFANAAARALLGPRAVPGEPIDRLIEGLGRAMDLRLAEAVRGDATGRPEIARTAAADREVFLQVSLTRLNLEGGPSIVAVLADATELKTLEAQFVQSQKMQAVGQLAGGVAHDFNNLLTAIAGHTDLLLQRHEVGDIDYADLTQVRQNANRAAGLVRQLLAFSRKQTLRPTVVNLADTLSETSHLLNRLLGEKTTLRIQHDPDLALVKVDERQLEQVIMNLVVNARDAMKTGGVVTIRTSNARISAERRRGRAVMPKGDYALIEVADQGHGIPADKIEQIFEPFFTTKKAGEGTGLGLSTVYGIIKQTGGFIFVDSTVGQGTTFSIYLPAYEPTEEERAAPVAKAPAPVTDLTGRGVVLLIEDETPVRAFGSRALKLRGYEVLEAASGEEALEILADPDLHVDVIVSDVVMPGMDGPSCVREARKLRPDVRVVFVSGYAEDALKRSMEGIGECHFLPKPFSLNELTAKVKECLTRAA
jgi:two-component system cell cycle sensor histidine kinase/response regulator CckA